MALEFLPQSATEPDAGIFNLPASFNRKEYAAKWVKVGHEVAQAQQRETLIGAGGVTADGWTVFTVEKKPHKVATSKAEWVLMYRPRVVQDQVNAVYGNVGTRRVQAEKKTAKTAAGDNNASGMLSEEALTRAGYREGSEDDQAFRLNEVKIEDSRVTSAPLDLTTA